MKMKRILSFVLSFVLLFSVFSAAIPASAAEGDLTFHEGYVGTVPDGDEDNSTTGLTYQSVFKENWEYGLDQNKWQVEKLEDDYVSDFMVVDDPFGTINKETGEVNKVITYTRMNTWLRPTNDYWPAEGIQAGRMKEASFRMYLKNADSSVNNEPGMVSAFCSLDDMDCVRFITELDGYPEADGFYWQTSGIIDGVPFTDKFDDPWYAERHPERRGFNHNAWFDVTIQYGSDGITITAEDNKEQIIRVSVGARTVAKDPFFVIGSVLYPDYGNRQQTNGVAYVDNIEVTFVQTTNDVDDVQTDINAYYAGNTFLAPGDTLDITGEDLGSTVSRAEIIKLKDDAVNLLNATYVDETTYYHSSTPNVTWDTLKKYAVEGSHIEDYEILQRSEYGVMMKIPDASVSEVYAEAGMYAVCLKPYETDAEAEIVIVNNPEITLLSHDDGDYATPDGWLKLGGSNLSVQNDSSKVHALIIGTGADGQETRTLIGPSDIEVDTTANNDVENHYYMHVNLNDMEPGYYQIMLHNGYGGDYGWSIPYDFQVGEDDDGDGVWETRAEKQIWRDMGIFNVQDYGAVGDSTTNDTAAIMRAVHAAEANGGGMIYFPSLADGSVASYRITTTLILPDNIAIVGDGPAYSILFLDGSWDIDINRHKNFLIFEKNLEISNIQLGASMNPLERFIDRNTSLNGEPGKVYMDHVMVTHDYRGTSSNGVGTIMEGYSSKANAYVDAKWANTSQKFYTEDIIEDYFAVTDCEIQQLYTGNTHGGTFGSAYAQYTLQSSVTADMDFQCFRMCPFKAGFFDDCLMRHYVPNTCARNVYSETTMTNNREGLYFDGTIQDNMKMQSISLEELSADAKEEDKTIEQMFEILLESELAKRNDTQDAQLIQDVMAYVQLHTEQGKRVYRALNGYRLDRQTSAQSRKVSLIVMYGQGTGQMRYADDTLVIGDSVYFTIDEPFAIEPNRSSVIGVGAGGRFMHNAYYNGVDIHNNGGTGLYGSGLGVVCDNYTLDYSNMGMHYKMGYGFGLMYYNTSRNMYSENSSYFHHFYTSVMGAGISSYDKSSYTNYLGIRYCDTTINGNGAAISLPSYSGAYKNAVSDIVYEDITLYADEPGLTLPNVTNGTMKGIWVENVKQYVEEGNTYSEISPIISRSGVINMGSTLYNNTPLMTVKDCLYLNDTRQPGDIDADGLVSMRDMKLIKYLLGEFKSAGDLNSAYGAGSAGTYADITENAYVNACDLLYMRAYILGDEEEMATILANDTQTGLSVDSANQGVEDAPGWEEPDIEPAITDDFEDTDKSAGLWDGLPSDATGVVSDGKMNFDTTAGDLYLINMAKWPKGAKPSKVVIDVADYPAGSKHFGFFIYALYSEEMKVSLGTHTQGSTRYMAGWVSAGAPYVEGASVSGGKSYSHTQAVETMTLQYNWDSWDTADKVIVRITSTYADGSKKSSDFTYTYIGEGKKPEEFRVGFTLPEGSLNEIFNYSKSSIDGIEITLDDDYSHLNSDNCTHDFSAEVVSTGYMISAASCTQQGVYYKSCTKCRLSSKGTDAEATFTYGGATGHTPATEWSIDSEGHWKNCTVCGEVAVELTAHTPNVPAATEDTAKFCTTCLHVMEYRLGYYIKDDFSDAAASAELWEGLPSDATSVVSDGKMNLDNTEGDLYLINLEKLSEGARPQKVIIDLADNGLIGNKRYYFFVNVLHSNAMDVSCAYQQQGNNRYVAFWNTPTVVGATKTAGSNKCTSGTAVETITYEYNWDDWDANGKVTITCTFVDTNGVSYVSSATYQYTGAAEDKPTTFSVGISQPTGYTTGASSIDSIEIILDEN